MANNTQSSKDEEKQIQQVEETIQQADSPAENLKSQDELIHEIIDRIEDNSAKVEAIVDELINKHCKEIDELMTKFKKCLLDKENPVTDWELDDVCMKLPSYLYFIGEAQEKFGIKEDIAKSVKMELYNDIHRRTKGTIADKQAASEAGTLEEDIVYRAYQRAYKRIKQKLEAAYEVVSSVKKVISRRMGEQELANVDSGKFRRG
jgi:hypothetical protein